jgi:hypothetical protein
VTMLTERMGTAPNTGRLTTPETRELMLRIQGEYREMPGLCLTAGQARRLWSIDNTTCERVLALLVERRILKQTATGAYVRGPSC